MSKLKPSKNIDLIAELRERKGLSYQQIADRLGCSASSISWYCLAHGIEKPGPVATRSRVRPGSIERRNGGEIRRFTPDEDRQLLALDAEGVNYFQIGKRMGRRRNSIHGRLMTLARREERGVA